MNYNTQNEKIAVITEKTLVVGIDIGREMHYARVFDYRGYEFSKKHSASVTMRQDLRYSTLGWRTSKINMEWIL